MSEYTRVVRVTYDATVRFSVPGTGDGGMDDAVADEAASAVALGFIESEGIKGSFPVGKPVTVWVSARDEGRNAFEGDIEVTRHDSSLGGQEAYVVDGSWGLGR